jgi:seryl-tRNA synthetase
LKEKKKKKMHNIKEIRKNFENFKKIMKLRNVETNLDEILILDKENRNFIQKKETLEMEKKKISKSKDESLFSKSKEISIKIEDLIKKQTLINNKLDNILSSIPNIPLNDVPPGKDENDNKELSKSGEIKNYNFRPKTHYEIGKKLNMLDFDLATKTTGSRFVFVKGKLAALERAISNFMIDTHTQINGYTEISPPLMATDDTMYGTGQLPKFENDQFEIKIDEKNDRKFLIPTAEVILTNMVKNKLININLLPMRLVASTPCFRKEAGSYGKDTKGMIRQHQFYKVELVSIVDNNKCEEELERMTNCATMILDKLKLPYRKIILSTADMGFSAEKTYDIEVWLPSENKYREISSCSSCGTFQARRMKARYKINSNATEFVGTLNGSGLAVGRTLIAIIENYQTEEGSINIPEVLKPYMGNIHKISIN